jgi:hypothetical protein
LVTITFLLFSNSRFSHLFELVFRHTVKPLVCECCLSDETSPKNALK